MRSHTSLRHVLILRCCSPRLKSMTESERNISVRLQGTYADTARGWHNTVYPRADLGLTELVSYNIILEVADFFPIRDGMLLTSFWSRIPQAMPREQRRDLPKRLSVEGYPFFLLTLFAVTSFLQRVRVDIKIIIRPYAKLVRPCQSPCAT